MIFEFLKEQTEALGEFVERRAREDQEAFARFTSGLTKSRDALLASLNFGGDASLDDSLDQLEEGLLAADIGVATTEAILADVKRIAKEERTVSPEDVKTVLRGRMVQVLSLNDTALQCTRHENVTTPTVIMVMGANGMGKTTTIGKLARRLRVEANQTVLVAACDTFRAAAVDQLRVWADRAEVDFFALPDDANTNSPSAAAFQAMDKAIAGNYDVVIVDTSGRLSNNEGLTRELRKIKETIGKKAPGAPQETLLVVDAAVGRNAVDQARTWRDEVGVTGLVVTKLDGTSRAGFCVAIVQDLQIPVKLVGVGERLTDLQDFDVDAFVDALLDIDPTYARSDLINRFKTLSQSYLDDEPLFNLPRPASSSSVKASGSFGRPTFNNNVGPSASSSRPTTSKPRKKSKKKKNSRKR